MNRFELMDRLSKELGSYVHINFVDKNKDFSEEDYQETLKFMYSMEEKAHERLLRTDKKDIVEAIKSADKSFKIMTDNNPNILTNIHHSWLLQKSLRNASLICRREAKKKFTPFKYRY